MMYRTVRTADGLVRIKVRDTSIQEEMESRERIRRLICESDGLTVKELAERTGLAEDTVRAHATLLVRFGAVRHIYAPIKERDE